ncbi:hypothetical protein AB4428_10090 [Vibrio lentus]
MTREDITFTTEEISLIYANAGLTHQSSKAKKQAAIKEAREKERERKKKKRDETNKRAARTRAIRKEQRELSEEIASWTPKIKPYRRGRD